MEGLGPLLVTMLVLAGLVIGPVVFFTLLWLLGNWSDRRQARLRRERPARESPGRVARSLEAIYNLRWPEWFTVLMPPRMGFSILQVRESLGPIVLLALFVAPLILAAWLITAWDEHATRVERERAAAQASAGAAGPAHDARAPARIGPSNAAVVGLAVAGGFSAGLGWYLWQKRRRSSELAAAEPEIAENGAEDRNNEEPRSPRRLDGA